ncbi:hypothetical protein AGLY_010679 [Aphis glycines]|uniref:Uncharacterized protein n=1 Tax=Aphis glycines TaxID=307491 RepID=A0A6G0TGG4_APHGL|nr:hypothetical protein AGLY_010679 [Aphis glycines]
MVWHPLHILAPCRAVAHVTHSFRRPCIGVLAIGDPQSFLISLGVRQRKSKKHKNDVFPTVNTYAICPYAQLKMKSCKNGRSPFGSHFPKRLPFYKKINFQTAPVKKILQPGKFPNGSGFYNTSSFSFHTDLKMSQKRCGKLLLCGYNTDDSLKKTYFLCHEYHKIHVSRSFLEIVPTVRSIIVFKLKLKCFELVVKKNPKGAVAPPNNIRKMILNENGISAISQRIQKENLDVLYFRYN